MSLIQLLVLLILLAIVLGVIAVGVYLGLTLTRRPQKKLKRPSRH